MQKRSKITILGAGNVGATIAYTLTIKGIASEIVLIDINKAKAKGEAMYILVFRKIRKESRSDMPV